MKKKINVVLAIFFVCIICLCLVFITHGGEYAVVYVEGEAVEKIELSREGYEYKISEHNILKIENGGVRMIYADCPDKVCVNQGVVYDSAYPIICLPNKVIVKIESESSIDAVSGR